MKLFLGSLTLICVSVASAAFAAPQCKFDPETSIPIQYSTDGRPAIAALMNGTEESLIIDTGAPISIIKDSVADELKLPLTPYPRTGSFPSGIAPVAYATVDTLSVGTLTGHKVRFYLVPTVQIRAASGSFGADFLQSWDADFDFAQPAFNFIPPDHCNSNPVYWTKQAAVQLQLKPDESQHLITPAKLDGKQIDAFFDTGAAVSVIDIAVAAQLFGIHEEGVHTFKSIDFGGLVIESPSIIVSSNSSLHGYQMLVGMPILRKLHLYVSYRNRIAYITPADVH